MEQTGAVASVATSFDTDVHFVFGLYEKEKKKKKVKYKVTLSLPRSR